MSFTLWFMGRPASGKSTIAKRVENRLRELDISVENLDGDEIRQNLHPDLGFSRADRAINNRRTAFISMLLNRNGIATVTGMITPFSDAQNEAREIVEKSGTFVLIYVKCPVEEGEKRDPKGLYEQARAGKIEKFTGVSHPFQEPHNPDIVVDTVESTIDESVDHVMTKLDEFGVFDEGLKAKYRFDISRKQEQVIEKRLRDLGYIE